MFPEYLSCARPSGGVETERHVPKGTLSQERFLADDKSFHTTTLRVKIRC